jgi:hypothetical protein
MRALRPQRVPPSLPALLLASQSPEINMWSLSPAVSSDSVETTLRATLFSCAVWVLSLHSISRDCPAVVSLAVDGDERYDALRTYRLQVLLRVLSGAIPLFDVRLTIPFFLLHP